jgi:hypothetical protein
LNFNPPRKQGTLDEEPLIPGEWATMNPYEPSQVTDLAPSQKPIPEFIPKLPPGIAWMIFQEWLARLWFYNGVLAIVFLSLWSTELVHGPSLFDGGWLLMYLNLGYFLGPLLEWLITKKRQRRVDWGPALFVLILASGVLSLLFFIAYAIFPTGFG